MDVERDLGAAIGPVRAHDAALVDRAVADARDLELAAGLHRDGRSGDDEVGDRAAERPRGLILAPSANVRARRPSRPSRSRPAG